MANFSDLSGIKQWATVVLGGAVVTGALYFTVFKSQSEKNTAAQHALEEKIRENNELESYTDYANLPTSPDSKCENVSAATGVGPRDIDGRWHFTASK